MEHLPEASEVLFPVGTLYPYDFVGDCPNPVRICSDEDLFIGHDPDWYVHTYVHRYIHTYVLILLINHGMTPPLAIIVSPQ